MIIKFNPIYFYFSCSNGRYDLMVKLYNYDNNLINFCAMDYSDNIFSAGLFSKNIEILQFIHSKNNTLYKKCVPHTPIMEACSKGNIEIFIGKFIITLKNLVLNFRTTNIYKYDFIKNILCLYN